MNLFYQVIPMLNHPFAILILAAILVTIHIWRMPKPVVFQNKFFWYSTFMVCGIYLIVSSLFMYLVWFIGMTAFNSDSMTRVVAPMMGMTGVVMKLVLFIVLSWLALKSFSKIWNKLS